MTAVVIPPLQPRESAETLLALSEKLHGQMHQAYTRFCALATNHESPNTPGFVRATIDRDALSGRAFYELVLLTAVALEMHLAATVAATSGTYEADHSIVQLFSDLRPDYQTEVLDAWLANFDEPKNAGITDPDAESLLLALNAFSEVLIKSRSGADIDVGAMALFLSKGQNALAPLRQIAGRLVTAGRA